MNLKRVGRFCFQSDRYVCYLYIFWQDFTLILYSLSYEHFYIRLVWNIYLDPMSVWGFVSMNCRFGFKLRDSLVYILIAFSIWKWTKVAHQGIYLVNKSYYNFFTYLYFMYLKIIFKFVIMYLNLWNLLTNIDITCYRIYLGITVEWHFGHISFFEIQIRSAAERVMFMF